MYKTQIACAIFVLIIGILYFSSPKKNNKSSKCFSILLITSFFQLLFDICSVYTVNHLDTVSAITNRIIHIFYMGLMLIIFYIAYKYIEIIIEEELGEHIKHSQFTVIPLIITVLGVIFLPLSYIESKRSNYSYGPAAFMTYLGVAIYLFLIIRLMLQYGKFLPPKKIKAINIALLSEIPVAVYQVFIPDSLITCLGMVFLNLGIYITTENPDAMLAEQLEKEKMRADIANEAKTNFLANMSHEIRTPITAVLGMNELILREATDPSIKQYAKDVDGAAKSLLSIINDILDISKIEKGKLSVISAEYDFFTVIKDVTNMISFKARVKELAFELHIDEKIPKKLIGDDIRLRQILVNLLNNAVKYTHKGTVTLEITLQPSELTNMANIYFCIKDTGIGIKEEDIQKLCLPFERIEEKRNRNIEGTGLGMSITKQLLSLLHSELKVHSVYGEGSEFSFALYQEIVDATPIGKFEEHNELITSEYQHTFEAPNAKILIVDDNDLNRKVFIGLLKSTKIQIEEAENGKQCLEQVMKNKYDIIFLDHMMPELDGIETFRIMKETPDFPSKNTPVIILTANAIVGAKEKYLQEGFTAFLEKPIDYHKLETMIKNLLDASLLCEPTMQAEIVHNPLSELPLIEGLDWNYARIHFHDDQTMTDTVTFFAESINYDASELETLFANLGTDTDNKNYCTKIHSMKNSASTIGIIPLAGMAKILEDSSRNNDTATVKTLHPIFITYWKSYLEKLSTFTHTSDKKNKKSSLENQSEVDAILQQIKQAAIDMDIDVLDQLWEQLDNYQFPENYEEYIAQIHRAIMDFDVDFLQNITL